MGTLRRLNRGDIISLLKSIVYRIKPQTEANVTDLFAAIHQMAAQAYVCHCQLLKLDR